MRKIPYLALSYPCVQRRKGGADHALIGLQAVGLGVSELSAAFSLALEMGARLEDVIRLRRSAHPDREGA